MKDKNNKQSKSGRSNSSSRGRSNYRKRKNDYQNSDYGRKDPPCERTSDDRTKGVNDLSWYTKYPNLSAASASLPFPNRPGMSLATGFTVNGVDHGFQIPGVMPIYWAPSVGNSSSSLDPISIVAKEMYARVRAQFSGSLEADAPDFPMYLMALDSIFSYIAWMKRVFRVVNAYTPENYQTPDALLTAMGFNTLQKTAMRAERVHLWDVINTLVLMSRKFRCPAVMDIFNRHYWMSDNVYTDSNSLNSQFYIFTPSHVLEYSEQEVTPGAGDYASGLQYINCTVQNIVKLYPATSGTVIDSMFQFGKALIESLVSWDDSYTISGYLAKAYDSTPSFFVDELAYDEKLTPVYNEEVLSQIENLSGCPYFMWSKIQQMSISPIHQDPTKNSVINPATVTLPVSVNESYPLPLTNMRPWITIRSDNPSAGDVIIATRLLTVYEYVGSTESTFTFKAISGSELCFGVGMVQNPELNTIVQMDFVLDIGNPETGYSKLDIAGIIQNWALVSQFDWHPRINFLTVDATGTFSVHPMYDLHNTTSVTADQLANIHRVCLFSEFNAFNQ